VGALIAGLELWAVATGNGDLWVSVILLMLGEQSHMIGPGAWSLDARFSAGSVLILKIHPPKSVKRILHTDFSRNTIRLFTLAATG